MNPIVESVAAALAVCLFEKLVIPAGVDVVRSKRARRIARAIRRLMGLPPDPPS